MMNMTNRLIDGFKRQDRNSIWKHLDALAENYSVYSNHLTGIGPQLDHHHVYIYTYQTTMVIVCIDNATENVELADEEPFCDSSPLYFTQDDHRISPVWQLSETLKLVRQKLDATNQQWTVWGVLLSPCSFINADCMRKVWKKMNVTVIDHVVDAARRKIAVNHDEEISSGVAAMAVLEDIVMRPDVNTPDDEEMEEPPFTEEEFNDMLEQFMDDESEMDSQAQNHDDEPDADEDAEEENDDSDSCENDWGEDDFLGLSDDGDSPFSDLPNDTIEQNSNVCVKLKILKPVPNPREELDRLVGCQDIKKRIEELLALTRYNKMVREVFPDAKPHEVSLHSIFFGSPGTGKTTVCKIFGSLLHEAGALSKGHVVVADRGTFIGTLWGDEERSVRQVLAKAQGGVLMIDEAYLLNGKHDHDPGKLILQLLMEVLADETQRDLAVVLCGYKEPMLKLLDFNPGLHSRFPNRFEFNDFTVDELVEITRRRVEEYRYRFTRQAWTKYRKVLTDAYQVRDPQSWGNARFVANLLEHIFIRHAQRCVRNRPAKQEQLLMLTPADIQPIEVARRRRHVGF